MIKFENSYIVSNQNDQRQIFKTYNQYKLIKHKYVECGVWKMTMFDESKHTQEIPVYKSRQKGRFRYAAYFPQQTKKTHSFATVTIHV